jgi:hypothetical protein
MKASNYIFKNIELVINSSTVEQIEQLQHDKCVKYNCEVLAWIFVVLQIKILRTVEVVQSAVLNTSFTVLTWNPALTGKHK